MQQKSPSRKKAATSRRKTTRRPAQRPAEKPKLSRALQYAKWIESPDEHGDRPGQTLVTRNPDVIRRWADERGARPAIAGRRNPQDPPRVLRLDFPGYRGDLEPISWDEWFRTFTERGLLFVFQEHKADGIPSNFFRLDNPAR